MDAMRGIVDDHLFQLTLIYKTELCYDFLRTARANESGCNLAHGVRDLRVQQDNPHRRPDG